MLADLASILLRQDSSWDPQNYQLYNAWALAQGRYGVDWAHAQLQSFYSPFLDLPFYACFASDVPRRVIALAIPTGIAWFILARIVTHLFRALDEATRTPAAQDVTPRASEFANMPD